MDAWSANTRSTRNSQWKNYTRFCAEHELVALPASELTVARFLLYKAKTVKYSTINNYLSSVISLHKYYGYECELRSRYFIKLVLDGLKSKLGQTVDQKIPLSVQELIKMYRTLNLRDQKDLVMWSAIVVSFRTLLRKSNLVPDSIHEIPKHVILRRDVERSSDGFLIKVRATKTIRYRERVLSIPVVRSEGSCLCAVSALEYCMQEHKAQSDSPVFVFKNKPIVYGELLKFLKDLVKRIDKNPDDVGLHSLRRSGAQFLKEIGTSLSDIMYIGDWRSLAVLSYLVTTFDNKKKVEDKASSYLAQLC